ncbi:MAG: C4-type zinc ribbon domain-containing protein [Anaerolineaceae bacterium]
MNLSFSLFRLQSLDTQRMQITKRLAGIEATLAADEAVRARLMAKNQTEEAKKQAQSSLNDLANQSATKRLKLELTQAQLFGGKIRNPKELQDLQAESEALKRTIAKLEDEQLDAMLTLESAQKDWQDAESEYQRCLDQKASDNSLLLGEKSRLETELPKLESQRQALVSTLPAEIIQQYQSLLKSKGGRALVEIVDECCEGCGVSIPPGDIQAARSSSKLIRCKNCGRFLYKA